MFRGKPTHHKVARNDVGEWTVNGKVFGDGSSIAAVLDFLRDPQVQGWPVPLVNPVDNVESEESAYAEPTLLKDAKILCADAGALQVQDEPSPGPALDEAPVPISTPEGEELNPPRAAVGMTVAAGSSELCEVDSEPVHAAEAAQSEPVEPVESHAEPLDNVVEYAATVGGGSCADPTVLATTPTPIKIKPPKIDRPEGVAPPSNPASGELAPKKRMSRAEKAALMAKEEAERQRRIEEALENRGRIVPITEQYPPKDHEKYQQFRQDQEKRKKDEEAGRLATLQNAEANAMSWKEQVLAKRRAKEKEAEAAKPPPKGPTKVELMLEARRKEEEERDAAEAAAREDRKKREAELQAKKTKSKESATKSAEQRGSSDEEYLASLPQWKRDKILRERAAEKAMREKLEADRALRLQEMREDRAAKEAARIAARKAAETEAAAEKKRKAAEQQAKADREAAELKARLAKAAAKT